jgi:hypothetical protein
MLISIWDVAFKWVELLVSHTHTCFWTCQWSGT